MKNIFIIAFFLLILYNMFSNRRCFPLLCFLNQREGLVANQNNIAKNMADISTLKSKLSEGLEKLQALNAPTGPIATHSKQIPLHKAEYKLLPARAQYALDQFNKDNPDTDDNEKCDFTYKPI